METDFRANCKSYESNDILRPLFVTPFVKNDTKIVFSLIVKDNNGHVSNPSTVSVIIKANPMWMSFN